MYSYRIWRAWYNGSYTVMAKPIRALELHYPMIQFIVMGDSKHELSTRTRLYYLSITATSPQTATFFRPQGGRCGEVRLYSRTEKKSVGTIFSNQPKKQIVFKKR